MKHWLSPLCAVLLCACDALTREEAVPPPISRAAISDFKAIRYLPFEDVKSIVDGIQNSFSNETPESYEIGPQGERIYSYLAISGGGSDGAFGAGPLNGWTEQGSRPSFKVVTGFSTGALIAP